MEIFFFSYEKLGLPRTQVVSTSHPNVSLPKQWVVIGWRSGWRVKDGTPCQPAAVGVLKDFESIYSEYSGCVRRSFLSERISFTWTTTVLEASHCSKQSLIRGWQNINPLTQVSFSWGDKCSNIQTANSRYPIKPIGDSVIAWYVGPALLMKVGIIFKVARHIWEQRYFSHSIQENYRANRRELQTRMEALRRKARRLGSFWLNAMDPDITPGMRFRFWMSPKDHPPQTQCLQVQFTKNQLCKIERFKQRCPPSRFSSMMSFSFSFWSHTMHCIAGRTRVSVHVLHVTCAHGLLTAQCPGL